MDAGDAQRVDTALAGLGFPADVAPVDSGNPSGPWAVYDPDTGADITDVALAALRNAPAPERYSRPRRGFVIPRST